MRLHAVFVPPIEALQDVLVAAQGIGLVPAPTQTRSGRLGRVLGRERAAAQSPDPALALVPSEEAFVRLARFGNVTPADAQSLAQAMGAAARTWPVPTVHVAGLVIDTTVPQPVITAQLGGDTDELLEIFASFLEVARRQSFFLDRRSFRPEFTVAHVTLPDDLSLRERIVFDAQDHRGPDWQAKRISMVRVSVDPSSRTFEEIASVTLGDAG